MAEQYGTHTFGDATRVPEPEHIEKARLYRRKVQDVQIRLDAEFAVLNKRHQEERAALTAHYDEEFRSLAQEAGWR